MRVRTFTALLAAIAWCVWAASPEAENPFHFAIVGDRTGSAVPGVYERVWNEIDMLHPDFVINVGDTIQGGDDKSAAEEWRALHPLFDRYARYPLYFTPGNHDVWSPASERLYETETRRPVHYGFDFRNAHFTVLDNSRTEALAETELRFLEADLQAHATSRPKFVFFHRAFWVLPLKLGSGEFDLHRLARKYGVNYVISGHGHQLAKAERDGIVYLEVGSSGASIARGINSGQGFKEGWFHHYVWATVSGGVANFTIKEAGPPDGEGRMTRLQDWK